jgi:uncharacterized protein
LLRFHQLPGPYAIVRLAADADDPTWANNRWTKRGAEICSEQPGFMSITRTDDELSVVCPLENVPTELLSGPRWICLKLEGPFPFSQTGVLLSFIEPLSKSAIPIFAVSTYDTDYVLVPEEFGERAFAALKAAEHEFAV